MTEIKVGQKWRNRHTGKVVEVRFLRLRTAIVEHQMKSGKIGARILLQGTLLKNYEPADAPHVPRPAQADWRPYPEEKPTEPGHYLVSVTFPDEGPQFTADNWTGSNWEASVPTHWALGPKPPRGAK